MPPASGMTRGFGSNRMRSYMSHACTFHILHDSIPSMTGVIRDTTLRQVRTGVFGLVPVRAIETSAEPGPQASQAGSHLRSSRIHQCHKLHLVHNNSTTNNPDTVQHVRNYNTRVNASLASTSSSETIMVAWGASCGSSPSQSL